MLLISGSRDQVGEVMDVDDYFVIPKVRKRERVTSSSVRPDSSTRAWGDVG